MLNNQVGAYRLSKEEIHEAETLGFSSASKYLRYKLNKIKEDLQEDPELIKELSIRQPEIKEVKPEASNVPIPMEELHKRIRAEEELKYLREKLQEQQGHLNGYLDEMDKRLQQELLRRDFESLKKEHAKLQKEFEELDSENEKLEDKNDELTKQLSTLETIKEFTPQIVNGLAGWFPKQAEKIANNLAGIVPDKPAELSEGDKSDMEFGRYFKSLFNETEREEVMNLCAAISMNKNLLVLIKQFLQRLSQNSSIDKQ